MGFPKIIKPEEYGFITPKGIPDFESREWEKDEDEPDVQLRTGVGPIQNALKYKGRH